MLYFFSFGLGLKKVYSFLSFLTIYVCAQVPTLALSVLLFRLNEGMLSSKLSNMYSLWVLSGFLFWGKK